MSSATARLRRVGRLARRRMRIDGDALCNGRHSDGQLTVQLSGLGAAAAGVPEAFNWQANRPIALVVVRSGIDGDDVAFHVGPASAGNGSSAGVGDGSGIRYIAFCYDAEIERSAAGHLASVASTPVTRAGSPSAAGPGDQVVRWARHGFDVMPGFGRLARAGSTA